MEALGVRYRRSPVMAIGRDIYVDSRMMFQRLEQIFPPSDAHPALNTEGTRGIAALLNKFVVDAGLFAKAVGTMGPNSPAFKNPAFVKDRAGFLGKGWSLEESAKLWPENIAHVRQCFDIIESLLTDGRDWIADTARPTLADLEGEPPPIHIVTDSVAYLNADIRCRYSCLADRLDGL